MDGSHWIPHDGPNPFAAEAAAGELELPEPEAERPATIVSPGDVPQERSEHEGYHERWRRLGAAAGSVQAGLNHGLLEPGQLPCPPHWHSTEEECFVILGGSGEVWLGEERFPVGRGHVLVSSPAGGDRPHAVRR